jgi:foldase protein PrsA
MVQTSLKMTNTVTEDELEREMNKMRKGLKEGETLEDFLKEKGATLKEFKRDLTDNILARKFISVIGRDMEASEKEMRNYYQEHRKDFFTPELFKISLLFAPTQEEGKEMLKMLREKRIDFSELAEKQPPSFYRDAGGKLGWTALETLPQEMAKAIASARPGELCGPAKGKFGYYIMRVEEKREKVEIPFGKAKPGIVHIIKEEKRKAMIKRWLQQERRFATIDIYLE